jgi:pimeloyl-ACP methyl ester carboxylesterase
MEISRNIQVEGSTGRPILLDVYTHKATKPQPLVIFCHGFKGFKDWGGWDLVGREFAKSGFIFIKFNFSHNGSTTEDPLNFGDLDAFGQNTFSKELYDVERVITWATENLAEKMTDEIDLIGHSRGGGIAILQAARDERISKLATWAAVNDFGYAWNEGLVDNWRKKEVIYAENKRTNQLMPLYFSLYEDFNTHREELSIEKAVRSLQKPFIAIHGTEDESVSFDHAMQMKKWNINLKLDLIPQGNHVFGMKHPYTDPNLPFDMLTVVQHTIKFFKG